MMPVDPTLPRPQSQRPGGLEPRQLDAVLVDGFDETQRHDAWQRLSEQRSQRSPMRRPRLALGVGLGLAVAGALAALLLLRPSAPPDRDVPGPLASRTVGLRVAEGATLAAASSAELIVPFDDGSEVRLAPGAQLDVMANRGDAFVTLLAHGKAHFDVRHGGPRRWQIETALATVEVVGTAFEIDRGPTSMTIAVERGVVMVRGERVPGRIVRLTAGEHLEIQAPLETATMFEQPPPRGPTPVEPAPPTPAVAPAATVAIVPRGSGSGSGSAARVAPVAPSVPPLTRKAQPIADALVAADALRARGEFAAAASTLTDALDAAGDSAGAGLAAFTLGRLAIERLDQPTRAARAFERMIAIGSPSSLLEDAYARRARAWRAAGNQAEADRAAADYARAYPRGHRLDDLTPSSTP